MAGFDAVRKSLAGLVPPDFFSLEQEARQVYGVDWTRVFTPNPVAVAFPRSTQEVARLLTACQTYRVPVVPSGGRTGLAAGAVAAGGELVVSMDRLNHLGPVDVVARTVRVGAGAITRAVHEHCARWDLTWPVDFASAGSSQVGGNIATNAGGVRVVRHGLTRQWVGGLTVVLMGGQVLELNGGLEKNNTGPDLRQLFIGSEGTLGVITEATLRLAPLPGESRVAFLAMPDLPAVLRVFEAARRARGFHILAFELLDDACLQVVLDAGHGPHPLGARSPFYVLIECELESGNSAPVEAFMERLFEDDLVSDGALAQSTSEAQRLWSLRETISESLTKAGFVHKNDIAVPVSRVTDFVQAMHRTFAETYPHYNIHVFGHVGDGNLHINIMKPQNLPKEEFLATCHQSDELLFAVVRDFGGSISAEHGIGLLKKDFLSFTRSPAELALFRGIKRVFDPAGLLNPGKIFETDV